MLNFRYERQQKRRNNVKIFEVNYIIAPFWGILCRIFAESFDSPQLISVEFCASGALGPNGEGDRGATILCLSGQRADRSA